MLSAKRRTPESQVPLELTVSREEEHVVKCQRLRYKVYCVERGWYNEVNINKGREYDEYDERAGHALLTRGDNGDSIGVVRLILPSGDVKNPALPIQEMKPSPFELLGDDVDMTRIAEVSRFSVTQDYNRRTTDAAHKDEKGSPISGGLSALSIHLMHGVVVMARENNIRYLCATMEPALLMLLARIGVRFDPLGEPREYHGLRQPCYCDLEVVEEDMKRLRPEKHPLIFG